MYKYLVISTSIYRYIYVYMYVCIYMHIQIHIYIHICGCVYIYMYMQTYTHTYTHMAHTYRYIYICAQSVESVFQPCAQKEVFSQEVPHIPFQTLRTHRTPPPFPTHTSIHVDRPAVADSATILFAVA